MTQGFDNAGKGDKSESGPIVIYDDGFYMGSMMAEAAATRHDVIFVTPDAVVAEWSDKTLEQTRIQKSLIDKGVRIIPLHGIDSYDGALLTWHAFIQTRSPRLRPQRL